MPCKFLQMHLETTVKHQSGSIGDYVGLIKGYEQCVNDIVEDEFLVIWDAFGSSRTRSSLFVWSPDEVSEQTRFSILNDALVKVNIS